jgi:hypothetical protein
MRKLNAWLSTLLRERGTDLYRSKGILSVHGSDERWAAAPRCCWPCQWAIQLTGLLAGTRQL